MDTLLDRGSGGRGLAQERPSVRAAAVGRAAIGLLGGAILIQGLKRRSLVSALLALPAAELIREGVTGQGTILRALGLARDEALPEVLEVRRTLTILRSPDELHALLREPETLQRLVEPMFRFVQEDETEASWRYEGPFGIRLAWRTRLVEERPNQALAWIAQPGALVPHEVSIRFRPAARDGGTEVTLRLRLLPPAGSLGAMAANRFEKLTGILAQKALRRFKSLAETGEIPTHRRAPACRNDGRNR